jgi:hypothetical protein
MNTLIGKGVVPETMGSPVALNPAGIVLAGLVDDLFWVPLAKAIEPIRNSAGRITDNFFIFSSKNISIYTGNTGIY